MKSPESKIPGNHFQADLAAVRAYFENARAALVALQEIQPAGPEMVGYCQQLCQAAARFEVTLGELTAALAGATTYEELDAVIKRHWADPQFQLARFDWRALQGWNDEPGEVPS